MRTLSDKTIPGATDFMLEMEIETDCLLFQIGSNDLTDKSVDEVKSGLVQLIEITKEKLPQSKLVVS